MKHPPHTFQEAESLCSRFRHLVGKNYGTGMARVTDVVIVPFDHLNKERFLAHYILSDNARSLQTDYQGLLFDVLVLGIHEDGIGLLHEPLHSWLGRDKQFWLNDASHQSTSRC